MIISRSREADPQQSVLDLYWNEWSESGTAVCGPINRYETGMNVCRHCMRWPTGWYYRRRRVEWKITSRTHDVFDVLLRHLAATSRTSLSQSRFHCQLFEHGVIHLPAVQLNTTHRITRPWRYESSFDNAIDDKKLYCRRRRATLPQCG